ncbi:MAG: trypsin-like serine protease, partial [Actinobacteria bacterium]
MLVGSNADSSLDPPRRPRERPRRRRPRRRRRSGARPRRQRQDHDRRPAGAAGDRRRRPEDGQPPDGARHLQARRAWGRVHHRRHRPAHAGQPVRLRDPAGAAGHRDRLGHILTNAHVVEGSKTASVRFEEGGDLIDADVVGRDLSTDIAVLKVDPSQAKLKPLALGNSNRVQVGDPAIAIGNPFGYDRTVTTGIISALQRQIRAPNGFTIDHVIQTDAAINPGNSGGPLLDAAGRVIGINSQIETGSGGNGNVGIGFAIPIDTIKQKLSELKTKG